MDLAEIRACGAQVLVSLMETQEFHSVAVSPLELSQQTRELGIEWIHTPIVDGSVPDDAFLEKWRSIALHLRESLDRGETIVFHCLGGLGRAGTMAACLLIETGFDPAAAIAAVRGARPGAIENKAQEDFVLSYAPMAR
jgi:ADP-ribosyl-[dinitrogen reductase] hydrolase